MEEEKKCICSCLFDLSFDEFITPKVVKIFYMVGIGIAGIVAIFLVGKAFTHSFIVGLLHVAAAPIVFLLLVVIIRMKMELLLTFLRIEQNTRKTEPAENAKPDQPAEYNDAAVETGE